MKITKSRSIGSFKEDFVLLEGELVPEHIHTDGFGPEPYGDHVALKGTFQISGAYVVEDEEGNVHARWDKHTFDGFVDDWDYQQFEYHMPEALEEVEKNIDEQVKQVVKRKGKELLSESQPKTETPLGL